MHALLRKQMVDINYSFYFILFQSNEFKPSLNTVQSNVIYTNDARNGEHNFVLSESLSDHSLAIMRLSWNESSSNGQL